MPQNFPTPQPNWAGGGAGSTYRDGGSAATYDPGGGGLGRGGRGGGWGGGASLQGQLTGLLDYIAARQDYLDNLHYQRNKRDITQRDNSASVERARAGQQARLAQPAAPVDKTREFMANKMSLDQLQAADPGAGKGYGQTVGQNFFNFPAASALTYGRDIFPNSWDQQAALAAAAQPRR